MTAEITLFKALIESTKAFCELHSVFHTSTYINFNVRHRHGEYFSCYVDVSCDQSSIFYGKTSVTTVSKSYCNSNNEITSNVHWIFRFFNYCRSFSLLLAHPLSILFVATLIDTYRMFPEELKNLQNFIGKSYVATQRALIYAIVDGTIYGNWLFFVVTSLYLPLWSLAWANLSEM